MGAELAARLATFIVIAAGKRTFIFEEPGVIYDP